ncbi:MAG TPA: GtrA family protein, partial [Candidatus Dormibacteraeota bacterium]|nr:GtrA family protein [Candidatus Dormibacteraeota bacterium]
MASDPAATSLPAPRGARPAAPTRRRDLPSSLPVGPARFAGASLATTALSLAVLVALVAAGAAPLLANLVATSAGAIVSYRLNRSWVWADRRDRGGSAELAAFWGLALAGLAISTLAVDAAGTWA